MFLSKQEYVPEHERKLAIDNFAVVHLLCLAMSLQTAVPCISTGDNFSLDRGNPSYCCPNNMNTGRFSINCFINRNTSNNIRGGCFGSKPISELATV